MIITANCMSMVAPSKTAAEKKKEDAEKEFSIARQSEGDKRYDSATRHYKRSAELGNSDASYKLGTGYYNAGYKLLKKAATCSMDSQSKASYELAHINFSAALKYLQQADKLGHVAANQKLQEIRQTVGLRNQETMNSMFG